MPRIEYKDHTEAYGCFVAGQNPRSLYPVSFDTAERMSRDFPDFDAQPYAIWIRFNDNAENISITIPAERDGHPIAGVTIDSPCMRDPRERVVLTYLYIPSTVRYLFIGSTNNPLWNCKVEISPENPYFCLRENGIYSKDMTKLYYIFSPEKYSDGCFEIAEGVELIKHGAGAGLTGLRKLVIPEGVTEIEDSTFECCYSLKEVSFPNTLREIGNRAFAEIGIKKLTLPPNIRGLGADIVGNRGPSGHDLTLEIYMKDGALPKMVHPVPFGGLLVVRSPETNEKLFEFVLLKRIDNMTFTEQGIDYAEYDELFKDKFSFKGFTWKAGFRAAQVRLQYIDESDKEKREFFKNYTAETAWLIALNSVLHYPNEESDGDIADDTYLDFVTDKELLRLIDKSIEEHKPEVTARLLQYTHERKSHE